MPTPAIPPPFAPTSVARRTAERRTSMADKQVLCDAAVAEPEPIPDPEEGQPDLEEESEREAGAGGSDEEEDVDVDGLASFLEFEILCGSSEEDPLDQQEEGEEEKEKPVIDDVKKGKRKQDSQSDGDDDGSGSGSEDEHQNRARREKGKGKALTADCAWKNLYIQEHPVRTRYGSVSVSVYGDEDKPALITFPDVALNYMSCFQGLFFCPEAASLLLQNFCIYHITPQGHEYTVSVKEMKQKQMVSFLASLERGVGKKLREKELEVEAMNRKSQELNEQIRQVSMQVQSWQSAALYNESVTSSLKSHHFAFTNVSSKFKC